MGRQLLSDLPVGAKVKFGNYQVETETAEPIIWQIAGKNHTGYPGNSVTLITEKIIDLRGFDAKEPNNTDADRKLQGNNRYKDSNLRQWLNKSGNPWFVKTHTADEPPNDAGMSEPTGYDGKNGFQRYFTPDEFDAVMDTTLTVAKNTATDGGGVETVVDKFYLPSVTEVGLANEPGGAEGSKLALFTTDASRIAKMTQQGFVNTKSTPKPGTVDAAWSWWLRSPDSGNSYYARYVDTSGALVSYDAYFGGFGVRPLCNLKSDSLVTETTDGDGCYVMVWTTPHIITLDKAITLSPGDKLTKLKFAPKINDSVMTLKEVDAEKLIYEKKDVGSESVTLKIDGTDAKIDKIAYTVS